MSTKMSFTDFLFESKKKKIEKESKKVTKTIDAIMSTKEYNLAIRLGASMSSLMKTPNIISKILNLHQDIIFFKSLIKLIKTTKEQRKRLRKKLKGSKKDITKEKIKEDINEINGKLESLNDQKKEVREKIKKEKERIKSAIKKTKKHK